MGCSVSTVSRKASYVSSIQSRLDCPILTADNTRSMPIGRTVGGTPDRIIRLTGSVRKTTILEYFDERLSV